MATDHLATLTIPRFHRAADYVGAWAIEPRAGQALLDLARRTDLRLHVETATPPKRESAVSMVKAGHGQQVAVLMLTGTLQKATSSMSGGTSTVQARADLRKAAADPDVSGILLAIDSPGGTVSGTADLAAEVRAAAKKKTVWAFIDDLGASAAYWIASQCDRIFANDRTALVGSIGTLSVVYDLSAAAEEAGIKALVFGTGPLKGTGVEGTAVTADQQTYIRGIVEDAQVAFDAAVQKGRNLTDKQLADVRTGGVFGATEAQSRKLIDGIQSFDQTVIDLAAEARRQQRANNSRAAGPGPQRSSAMNLTETLPAAGETVAKPATFSADIDASVAATIKAQREALAAENERVAAVQKHCAKYPTLAAQAIREGWSGEKAELAAMKMDLAASPVRTAGPNFAFGAGRYQAGAGTVADGVSVNAALEAGLRLSLYGQVNASKVEKDYRPEILQAARENFPNISLQGLFLVAAAANGYHAGPGERIHSGNIRQVLRHAYGVGIERVAVSSTIGMSGILGNVANKELLAGYVEEDMTWKEIASVRSVQNFQQHTSYRMLDDMEYEELGPDGKIKHGTLGQESYTRQAKTYAKMFSLNRTNIINDDLGAFQDLRTRLGRGSSKKFNKIFWTAFVNNSSFFTSGRTNYITGATTNLGTDGVGLGLGVKGFRLMKSPNGTAPGSADGNKAVNADTQNPVGGAPGGRPEILLVPPELEGSAEVLYRNQNLGQVKSSDANIYQNKYRPVVAWQLSDSGYTGYSTTAWYLLNNPGYLAAMVVSFLNGNMAPTVESAEGDFDELCVQFRGYHDFGCDQAEYLAGIKSKGAA